jgi:hypothetical protein
MEVGRENDEQESTHLRAALIDHFRTIEIEQLRGIDFQNRAGRGRRGRRIRHFAKESKDPRLPEKIRIKTTRGIMQGEQTWLLPAITS